MDHVSQSSDRARDTSSDRPRGAPSAETLRTATRLFAAVGYDGVTVEMLHSAGIRAEELASAGGKACLYKLVMEDLYRQKFAALEPIFTKFTPDAAGILMFANAYLDFHLEHPEMAALWVHRQLADAADISDLESRYTAPFYEMARIRTEEVITPGLCPNLMLGLFAGFVQGYVVGGFIDHSGKRVDPQEKSNQRFFRDQLQRLSLLIYGRASQSPDNPRTAPFQVSPTPNELMAAMSTLATPTRDDREGDEQTTG